jgi:hypothetical protein
MNISIYTSDFKKNQSLIQEIKTFLSKDYQDIFICTSLLNDADPTHASLHPFYLPFFDGVTVFISLEEYIEYKDKILGRTIIYIETTDTRLNRSLLNRCDLLTRDPHNKLIMVNNYAV